MANPRCPQRLGANRSWELLGRDRPATLPGWHGLQAGTHGGDGVAGIRQLHGNKAETEEMQPQPGDAWDHRELEEAGRLPRSQRECGPSVTWILDSWHPGL